jgi:hypothetical protein
VAPRTRNAHAHFLELLLLLGRQELLDFGIGSIELSSDLRLNAGHDRIDADVMLIDDALHIGFLLRCEIELAVEMLDDSLSQGLRRRRAPAMENVKAIAGNADEQSADENGDQRKGGRRARPIR